MITVSRLIEILHGFDPDLPVVIGIFDDKEVDYVDEPEAVKIVRSWGKYYLVPGLETRNADSPTWVDAVGFDSSPKSSVDDDDLG